MVMPEVTTRSQADPSERATSVFDSEFRTMTIGLVLVVTLVAFEALAVSTVMPAVEEDLGGVRIYGWAFSGFLLTSLIGITWAGVTSDRGGVVRPFVTGLILLGAGLVIASLAPEMWVVVLGRCLQGLGAGVIPAIVYVVIARGYDEQQRPRLFALMSSAWVIPGLAGPGVAGAVAEYVHWRFVFAGLLPLLAIAGAMVIPAMRAVPAAKHADEGGRVARAVPRAIQLSLGVALILGGINSGNPWWATGAIILGVLVAAPALRRLLPAGTLTAAHGLPASILGMGLLNMTFFGAAAFVPFMVTDVRGYSTITAGLVVTSSTLSWTSGTWIVDRYVPRFEVRVLAAWGLATLAVGVVAVAVTLIDDVPIAWTVFAWGIAGLGIGVAYPCFSLSVLRAAVPGGEGTASAAMKLNEVLGAALGTGLVGALVAAGEAGGWQREALAVGFGSMALASLMGLVVTRRLPRAAEYVASS